MDPFLVNDIARARFFRGEIDVCGRPRKIKSYERNVLLCIAINTACPIDLKASLSKSSLKDGKGSRYPGQNDVGEWGYDETSAEKRLVCLLANSEKMSKAEIARQLNITFRRSMVIVSDLQKIGVVRNDYTIDTNKLTRHE